MTKQPVLEQPKIKPEDKLALDNEKAVIIRPWIVLFFIANVVTQGIDLGNLEDSQVIVNKIVQACCLVPIFVCLVASCCLKAKMKSIQAGIIFLLLRIYVGTFIGEDILRRQHNPEDMLFRTTMQFLALKITTPLLLEIFNHGFIIATINSIITILGMVYRYYGFSSVPKRIGAVIANCLVMLAALVIITRIQRQLLALHKKTTEIACKLKHEMIAIKKVSQEYADMFQALEEAIVVVKDGKINFTNEIFKSILDKVGEHSDEASPLSLKIFKIFRETDATPS